MLPVVETVGYLLPFVAQSLFAFFHLPDVVRATAVHGCCPYPACNRPAFCGVGRLVCGLGGSEM